MLEAKQQAAPFFIVGCSRSGTTLLQVLIDAHPDLAIPPESHIYDRFGPFLNLYGDLTVSRNRGRFIAALLNDSFIRQWQLDIGVTDVERRLRRADRIGVIDALFCLYAENKGAVRWGDKTPEHIRYLREIRADFPQARLIHLIRDGRDVAEAMRRMVFGPVTAFGLAHEWRREVGYWGEFCGEYGTANTLLLSYEDLVTQPHESVSTLLRFIGARELDTVSRYASTSLSRNLATTQKAWHSSLRKGISTKKIGIYRAKFSAREIELFESIAGEALEAYGYPRDNVAPRGATLPERMHAAVADRCVRWARKIRHAFVIRLELQFRLRVLRRALYATSQRVH